MRSATLHIFMLLSIGVIASYAFHSSDHGNVHYTIHCSEKDFASYFFLISDITRILRYNNNLLQPIRDAYENLHNYQNPINEFPESYLIMNSGEGTTVGALLLPCRQVLC